MATFLTQVGEEQIVDKLDTATKFDWVGWGTGTGHSKSSTGLITPASESRVQGTVTQPLADQYQVVSTITCAGAGKTITEAVLFNASTSGQALIAGDFTGIALNVGDKIEFTFLLEIT